MKLKNKLLLFVLPFIFIGCASVEPKPVVVNAERINMCSEPSPANSVVMRSVKFTITQDKHGIYWISLSPRDYENLSKNTSDILAHIKEKNAIIKYYKECYTNDKIE